MPKRFAKPPSTTDMRLVGDACRELIARLQQSDEQDWHRPYLDGRLEQALTNVRGAVKRDREATAALCR